jgi:hypothetical protein
MSGVTKEHLFVCATSKLKNKLGFFTTIIFLAINGLLSFQCGENKASSSCIAENRISSAKYISRLSQIMVFFLAKTVRQSPPATRK